MRYVSAKHETPFKEARSDMAKMYRDARKKDHRVARLVWHRVKAAQKMMIDKLYEPAENQSGGLASLIKYGAERGRKESNGHLHGSIRVYHRSQCCWYCKMVGRRAVGAIQPGRQNHDWCADW